MVKSLKMENLIRNDGKLAYSHRDKRIAETRLEATAGRIQKVLGKDDTFSKPFKDAILGDYNGILERFHLELELSGAKQVNQSLTSPKATPVQKQLLKRLRADPKKRRGSCILCPVWRHTNAHDMTIASVTRYLFPEKRHEVFLLTVVMDFAENLEELADDINTAHRTIDNIVREMNRREMGLVMLGSFEPDLRSEAQLKSTYKDLNRLMTQIGRVAPQSGGWVLTGHFLVRAPHIEMFRELMKEAYPSGNWKRVQLNAVHKDKTMAANVMDVMGYIAKYPKPLFKNGTRGLKRRLADASLNRISTVFLGPTLLSDFDSSDFDVDAAIRQWSEFIDTMGPERMMYSVETVWAQKWYSQSEWQYIRATDLDMVGDGCNLVEPHRGRDFDNTCNTKPRLVGKLRRLVTRPLKYDQEWEDGTDLHGVDPFTTAVDLDGWIMKKAKGKDAKV